MALTQSARMAGPSWDEEVVPALRKRLESESRTLARRMSAISLSSVESLSSAFPDKTMRQTQASPPANSYQQSSVSSQQRQQSGYQRQPTVDRTTPVASNRVTNGTSTQSSTKTPFQRARTYSSPYASDLPNGHANGHARPGANNSQSSNPASRPAEIKPTRIPKASRPPISSAANSPLINGSSHSPAVTPYSLSPEQPFSQILPDQRQRGIVPSSSTQSSFELSYRNNRQPIGLLNESPPFPTDSTMSSGFTQAGNYRNASLEEAPPRASTDSEERPYEHWYRGEVSRNGGVGELRVGRRQEMLDIANYGHLIESKKNAPKRLPPMNVETDTRRARKRAGSIAGITNKERERESIYLDEEHVDDVGRVMDENPLTDLEGEGSEVQSLSEGYSGVAYAYIPGAGDTPSNEWTTVAGAHERSTTPTPSMLPRPSSRQQGNVPPTRIPGPSSRRSSESRSTVNTSPPIGGHPNGSISSSSKTPTASPPPAQSSSSSSRLNATTNNTSPTSAAAQKRGISPGSKKARGPAAKAITKSKTAPGRQQQGDIRESVAYYPTPAGDGEDMADAIPSWTQPVPKEGNWDEVVLPVVARKKGLDRYYEEADGSPKPKKIEKPIAPAPGTFGFDGTKYRPPRGESIPMDEFGRPAVEDEQDRQQSNGADRNGDFDHPIQSPTVFDEQRRKTSPSPAPFSDYAPPVAATTVISPVHGQMNGQQQNMEEEEGGGGCCKCVIM
ncbi:hypothetical protein BDN70DRAFT_657638 [Pholiota conissans]|uniref:Uncharacterized protein n=1 Tax=Pholiota conissans TaxID=109636 RepID=A0A9P5Z1Y9_9AGAR|nr:hypothetical protein BDN70DRAFT_657638 [Pholiota conissans]